MRSIAGRPGATALRAPVPSRPEAVRDRRGRGDDGEFRRQIAAADPRATARMHRTKGRHRGAGFMNPDVNLLISGYLDEVLSPDEHAALDLWLKGSPENARRFAQAVLLHDRLGGVLRATAAMADAGMSDLADVRPPIRRGRYRPLAAACVVAIAAAL